MKRAKELKEEAIEVDDDQESGGKLKKRQRLEMSSKLLLDLGKLVRGKVVSRPSKVVRTPYVADVELSDGSIVQAHAPMLACAGMVAPGTKVDMIESKPSSTRKTTHSIQLVFDCRFKEPVVVGAHPSLAERFAKKIVDDNLLAELGSEYKVASQKTFGNSRVDFVLTYPNGKTKLIEVKNVVCADDDENDVQAGVLYQHRACIKKDGHLVRSAIFPDGKLKPKTKVVSERAIKHVHELTELHRESGNQIESVFLFLVNRSDTDFFRPCHETCPLFAQVLLQAKQQGVCILAYNVHWNGGKAFLGKKLQVVFPQAAPVEQEWLSKVLQVAC